MFEQMRRMTPPPGAAAPTKPLMQSLRMMVATPCSQPSSGAVTSGSRHAIYSCCHLLALIHFPQPRRGNGARSRRRGAADRNHLITGADLGMKPDAPPSEICMTRRRLLGLLAAAPMIFTGVGLARALQSVDWALLAFLDRLPQDSRTTLVDDAKLLLGWVTDAAALRDPLPAGRVVDRASGFPAVPGFAAPTRIDHLAGRYRVLRAPHQEHGYYGLLLGLLDQPGTIRAVLVVNRLFRLPVLFQEPLGVATDIAANAGLLLGFGTAALGAARAMADAGYDLARRLDVPLIATGQSQAGGTAQLQIAAIAGRPGWRAGQDGFITFNATCSSRTISRLGADPVRLPGVNFAKDLDPVVGPHTGLANHIGLQIYIHPDGSASLRPQASFFHAALHPREHFLDSFNDVSLSAVLEAVRAS